MIWALKAFESKCLPTPFVTVCLHVQTVPALNVCLHVQTVPALNVCLHVQTVPALKWLPVFMFPTPFV